MSLVVPSKNIIAILLQLHPLPSDHVPPLIFYYQPKHTFVLDRTLFTQALTIIPHLFSGGLFGMVYEHLLRCFILEDQSLGFSKLLQVGVSIVHGDISLG